MTNKIEVHGFCDERFTPVKEAFAKNFEAGLEVGASVAVTLNGEFVVDLWGGYADGAQKRPWEQDTIVNVYSTTKIMTALCVLMLVDRDQLNLDAPVVNYWPEFAQAGKENIPVRYLLSHQACLPGFTKPLPVEALYDWDRIVNILAAQKPWWPPGTKSCYHAITFGYLLGELVRRITGKTLGTFFREEIGNPLKADFHIGLAEEHDFRVAELVSPPITWWKKLLLKIFMRRIVKVLYNPPVHPKHTYDRAWRAAEIPAANGHGNARSVARIASVLARGGELDNIRLLSLSTIEKAIEEQFNGRDLLLGPIRWGLGFGLKDDKIPFGSRSFYWGGAGGSSVVMDPDTKMSFAYVMNKMNFSLTKDPRVNRIAEALISSLKEI
ncbi:MAG: serine hydrolase domain-containing protein [Promethearchaeota archaeon]